jgi:chlorophyllide a reductase subunit X
MRPKPLIKDALLNLFSSDEVGRDVVLEPATVEDMCGKSNLDKPSLEVVYDDV